MKNVLTVFVFAFLFLLSCSNDSESDLTGPQTGNENEFVTYNDNIKAVISNNCLSCHSSPPTNGAPFSLTTYTQVKIGQKMVRCSQPLANRRGRQEQCRLREGCPKPPLT